MEDRTRIAVQKGIFYLHEHQLLNGEFCCYMALDPAMEEWCMPHSNVFANCLVGECLLALRGYADGPYLEEILEKARYFLDFNQHWGSVWNYFTRFYVYYKLVPFDIDVTVCASAFLLKMGGFKPYNIPLLLSNRNKKGLFYTWFVMRKNVFRGSKYYLWACARELRQPFKSLLFWMKRSGIYRNDVELVVNANVLYYLGDRPETKPVVDLINQAIISHKECGSDRSYKNPLVIYYFISRNYANGVRALEIARQPIIDRVCALIGANGQIGHSVLDTALAVSILLNFSSRIPPLKQAVAYILSAQLANGSWPRSAVWAFGLDTDTGYGSEELTTGFCLEALAKYTIATSEEKNAV